MIRLTRLGGGPFILNADLIRYVEELPDTFITLVGGERAIVLESMDEVMRLTIQYQQTKHLIPSPCAEHPGQHPGQGEPALQSPVTSTVD